MTRKHKEERKNTLGLESNSARSNPYLSKKSCFFSSLVEVMESVEKKIEWKEWWDQHQEREMEKLPAAETTRAPRRRRRKAEGGDSEKGRRGRLGCGRGQRGGGDGKAVEEAMAMSVPSLTLTPERSWSPRFCYNQESGPRASQYSRVSGRNVEFAIRQIGLSRGRWTRV